MEINKDNDYAFLNSCVMQLLDKTVISVNPQPSLGKEGVERLGVGWGMLFRKEISA